jgi:hypothetical protein
MMDASDHRRCRVPSLRWPRHARLALGCLITGWAIACCACRVPWRLLVRQQAKALEQLPRFSAAERSGCSQDLASIAEVPATGPA